MRKRTIQILIAAIVAAALAAVFIYIAIILVSDNKRPAQNTTELPGHDNIILRSAVPLEAGECTVEEVCTLITTLIINDAGYRDTYIPVNTEIITGEESDFYSKVCKKQQFIDDSSYDAMLYSHYSKQAAKMTEIVKTYKSGRRMTSCIWGYSENFWEVLIADYTLCGKEHQNSVKLMCDLGVVLPDEEGKVHPKAIADEKFLQAVFDRLRYPEKLTPAYCFKINDNMFPVGVGEACSYVTLRSVNKWISDNGGDINRFVSFDLNGANLSICFSTEEVGLLCWPLDFHKGAVFSFDTGKYNEAVIRKILELCFCITKSIIGENEEACNIDDIITEIKKENFEGIFLHTGKNALTAPEISVFQLDANGIRIQFKSKGEDRT